MPLKIWPILTVSLKVYGKMGRPAEAIECYRKSIAIRPNAPAYVAWALLISSLARQQEENRLHLVRLVMARLPVGCLGSPFSLAVALENLANQLARAQ